jgi:hypothetical protein
LIPQKGYLQLNSTYFDRKFLAREAGKSFGEKVQFLGCENIPYFCQISGDTKRRASFDQSTLSQISNGEKTEKI